MKKIILSLLIVTSFLVSDELSIAYSKEYAFLKAQKQEFKSRLSIEKRRQDRAIKKAKNSLELLRKKLLSISNNLKSEQDSLYKAEQSLKSAKENGEIVNNIVMQATESLKSYGLKVDDSKDVLAKDKLKKAFEDVNKLYKKFSSIRDEKGSFYLLDGSKVDGKIIKVGNIAAYGISTNGSGALAPAGMGELKLWAMKGSSDDAKAFSNGKSLETIDIFIYENIDKEIEAPKVKTTMDLVKSGGIIGYVILILGLVGLILLLLRVLFLSKSNSNVSQITNIVIKKFKDGKHSEALDAVKEFKGSTARVIKATLRNINREREHLEDIVMENILNESSSLDRFGNFVLVIAAVAPLLGLLGTVSGMIATFDIITEFGTGDPKLLAGGISEALVTTMLGLIVAIPLLLLGNLLAGWAQNIKDSMEQSALHIVNLYEKTK